MSIKIKELRQKSKKELYVLLKDEREQLRKLRFENSEGKMRRNHLFAQRRKTIAKILTILKHEA
ncbi:MAG: 50S ribosomal protein L29 [Candidatus Moranbacteria bacterium]|nr:50S ribosomal protein L29 [Candidatus Moranbacteria bacterium]